jgi:hypothetical protein
MEKAAAHARYTGCKTIDWIIHNLIDLDPRCASAKCMLRTSGDNTYTPDAFDADLLALNVESRQTIWDHGLLELHVGDL